MLKVINVFKEKRQIIIHKFLTSILVDWPEINIITPGIIYVNITKISIEYRHFSPWRISTDLWEEGMEGWNVVTMELCRKEDGEGHVSPLNHSRININIF